MYSYDIFDTVIWRTVPSSVSIFDVMKNDETFTEYWTEQNVDFAKARKNSEFIVRRIKGGGISVEEIYSRIGRKYAVEPEKLKKLIELELRTEGKSWVLNPFVLKEIKENIRKGEKVVLISDMYWDSKHLRKNLVMLDAVFAQIPIYVSCEWNATKASGKLYRIVKEQEGIDFEHWKHIGDNKHSDYQIPKTLGIEALCINSGIRYSYEKRLDINKSGTLTTYKCIVNTRTRSNGVAFDLGASFAAPMVYQYVDWCIERALELNIEKLFFVLRDGYILKRVADTIISRRGLKIETEDLFGSRVAWRRSEITVDKLKRLSVWDKSNWIFRDPCYAYVAFERLGFSKEELLLFLCADDVQRELLSFRDFKALLDKALSVPGFCIAVERKANEAGKGLVAYFRQMLSDNVSFAFVDTNSTGKSQVDLSSLLKKEAADIPTIRFFYHTFLGKETDIDPKTQYIYQIAGTQDRRFPEALFRAPYKPCYGYAWDNNEEVQPVFFQSDYCAWNGVFDYDSFLGGILSFTEEVEKQRIKEPVDLDAYVNYLLDVANFDVISKDIINQVGALPFGPDLYGNETLDFYPKLTFKALLHPFSDLIYYPKGSFYRNGGLWIWLYKILFSAVTYLRRIKAK